MTKAVLLDNYGAADVLRVSEIQNQEPNANEILIKQEAIGVNYHDVLYRSGRKKLDNLPNIVGFEAAGVIEALGDNVKNFKIGQKVAYATAPIGAYRSKRCINQQYVVAIPEGTSTQLVAACLFKGLVAHSLLFRVYMIRQEDTILIHSAASGVGSIMTQWANSLGVRVIGTVGSEEKKDIAIKNGCAHVFNRKSEDWAKGLLDLTNGKGVVVAYDSVGAATMNDSIKVLSKFGFLVLFGESSGKVTTINTTDLEPKSLFFSAPSVFDYKFNKMELVLSANEIFEQMKKGLFQNQIAANFSLDEASKAHQLLESGKSVNSVILHVA